MILPVPTNEQPNEKANKKKLESWLIQAFRQLIVDRTGLKLRTPELPSLCEKILARTQAIQQSFPENYYQLLAIPTPEQQLKSDQEWANLITLLTNGESFFFRDQGQFSVLERHILPELIQRKASEKKLRICSAGCAAGEEPYSIAIVLQSLIPTWDDWEIALLGVDINPTSIERAQTGIYREWSLRGVEAARRAAHFEQMESQYHIDPQVRERVDFQQLNLVSDGFEGILENLDLIICRNVFIYFDEAAIATVINKFYNALAPQGYLITGHTELSGQDMQIFQMQTLPDSFIFQRPAASASGVRTRNDKLRQTAPSMTQTVKPKQAERNKGAASTAAILKTSLDRCLQQAQVALNEQDYRLAKQQVKKVLDQTPHHPKACCLMAQIYIACNQLQQATDYCEAALKADSCLIEPHYILAQIAADQNNTASAKRILRKIIYLDSEAVVAYLELSQLYQQEGNLKKSAQMRQLAFDIFAQHLPPASPASLPPSFPSSA